MWAHAARRAHATRSTQRAAKHSSPADGLERPLPLHVQAFFRCVSEPSSEPARWLRGLKKQMNSLIFRRKLYEGESLDNSASEIYLPHVKEVCAAFARANTAEAASRKLAVK